MDFTDIQQDYHNVRLIFMYRDRDDQNFRQQKSQLFWKKPKSEVSTYPAYPAQCQGHGSGEKGALMLHMSAWDMRGCDNVSEKRWWWDEGEEIGYTSAFLSYKSSHVYSLRWHYCI